ncbi:MAG: helix-turn-helix transcriptional regulator [Clostridium sp.]|uniref:helix-turn-helix domain-containing protein n=1 Tax=Clostridium TaxID=1485 RepID=UPI0028FE910C|nr:helix-turn-helix transcriptional regulator [Clostridium sp.]MBS4958809.1 helix-turn-helix transcriptional regulator [Clostridium sp.]MDU1279245.1 helix-turn-helix transcriptional regulator [Clostridium sp.]
MEKLNYKLKIKEIRIHKGLSQNELANRIGISANYLSELEHNKFDIRFGLLLKIAEELNVKIDELYEKIE